jgi:hypothetical protein
MKKSDIAMIILIASVSILVAYFVAKSVVGDVRNQSIKVKIAEPISKDIDKPDPKTFNSNAINPTVEVIIGGDGASSQNQ